MTLSIWRYCHLLLALITSVFIFIASVTGIILAFEPIANQLQPYYISDANNQSLAKTIQVLNASFEEIIALEVDENSFVKASVITKEGNSGDYYINPISGDILGQPAPKQPIFEFATHLHRSLFLKSVGRFIIGLVSFLLFLIAVTGIVLIAKRQGGFRRWFTKVIKENFEQYYHVVLGRYALIPIVIITLTGVFLSLERFSVLPKNTLNHEVVNTKISGDIRPISEFGIFKTNTLDNLVSIEFPFSDDKDDYFILKLKSKEVFVNQYTGQVLSTAEIPLLASVLNWSILLHTGQGTTVWSIILGMACVAILFFMYSGFAMTLQRSKDSKIFKNKISKDEAEYIVLVGSETGNTYRFAKQFAEALTKEKSLVFVDYLDNYSTYKKAKQLIVFTATYGEGESPSNSKHFEDRFRSIQPQNNLKFSVVGFGSLLYKEYCKYAVLVDNLLQKHENFNAQLPLFKINNQSFEAFKTWVKQWSGANNLDLVVQSKPLKVKCLKSFTVVKKTAPNTDDTFLIQLKPNTKQKFASGDLLALYPEGDKVERLYSIGKVNGNILLSVKRHHKGVCSNFLNNLTESKTIKAKIKRNLDFHFPAYANEVIMIANGTGIAPFIGMITQKHQNTNIHLFWGGRTKASLQLYDTYIKDALQTKQLNNFYLTYSQEEEKTYVQDKLIQHETLVIKTLENGGIIMICGAIAMQNSVLERLEQLVNLKLNKPLSYFENNEQLLMDCY